MTLHKKQSLPLGISVQSFQSFLRICSHFLKKTFDENLHFLYSVSITLTKSKSLKSQIKPFEYFIKFIRG